MDDSERSIESFDFFNESETLALEEVENEQTGRVGTLEVPLITKIVQGRVGQRNFMLGFAYLAKMLAYLWCKEPAKMHALLFTTILESQVFVEILISSPVRIVKYI